MSELKPCPFCGGEANTQIFDKVLNVGCPHCDIRTRFVLHDELDAAVEAWNTRHVETCTIERNESGCNFVYRLYTLSCGHTVWTMGDAPNYCMTCGRKVER